jgi:hypothetical protein
MLWGGHLPRRRRVLAIEDVAPRLDPDPRPFTELDGGDRLISTLSKPERSRLRGDDRGGEDLRGVGR